jgi:arylsulfatase A-like enzyme
MHRALVLWLFFWVGSGCAEQNANQPPVQPNILVIMADDLGFTDLGAFGGEIKTPNLDALARSGLRFSNFHAGPSCAPTRSMLMTGTDNHLAGMGSQGNLATVLQQQSPAYQNKLDPAVPTIAEHLRKMGYATFASAKWHLGADGPQQPNARGFDRSFVLLEGGGGHFDDTPIFEHNGKANWQEDGKSIELPATFYSSDYITDKLLEYVDEVSSSQPIFAYLSYTAPHWPLQAPAEDVLRYQGQYDSGWHDLNGARMAGAQREGVIGPDARAVKHEPGLVGWDSLDSTEQANASRRMEVYAAMVDRLDQNVGRVLTALETSGRLSNTVIVFLADNGAEAHQMELYSTNPEWIPKNFNNELANIGTKTSYTTLGQGWARATAAPFRDSKSKLAEGGIRVPAFVSLPTAQQPRIDASFMRVMDLAPTFIELAGGERPESMMGRSLLDLWQGGESPYSADEIIAAETYGRRLAQRGEWKALLQPPPFGTGQWQLYNLGRDLGEQEDLALEFPQVLAELVEGYEAYANRVGVIDPETPIGY